MMKNDENIIIQRDYYITLYDYYGDLLTPKQKQYFSDFYDNDLTELEINSEVTIDSSAFKNNKLNSLTINKTITLGSTSAKPFEGNTSLNQNNVKFGYYSTNTFADLGIS